MGGGAGVKNLWRAGLGIFRAEDVVVLASLPDKRIAIDVSAWVHKYDGIWEVAYARTSIPPYPHPAPRRSFSAKVNALKRMGIHPIFVFDGKAPSNMKTRTNRERQAKSIAAERDYRAKIDAFKASGRTGVTEDERKEILALRRKIAKPTPEDYAALREWMEKEEIECVQAPFEADAQLKQIVKEGRATGVITEDGDLVVYEVPHILSQTKIDNREPKNSTCQYFDLDKLKSGEYSAEVAKGKRADYLPEISCFLGNDYINNLPDIGPAKIFGTGRYSKQQAVIDAYIEIMEGPDPDERKWLLGFESSARGSARTSSKSPPEEAWSVDRFIATRNLLRHYPVFKRDAATGNLTLGPLNPLPDGVSLLEWGKHIGFEMDPHNYFSYEFTHAQYYSMDVVGSTDKLRGEHLGPKYSTSDNPDVDTSELLPLWTRIDFAANPIEVQPPICLKYWLLNHGVETAEGDSFEDLCKFVHQAMAAKKVVLNPALAIEPVAWVGFEPLDELELNDKYDDWNDDYVAMMRSLKLVDNDYIDRHYGTESAQYERATAMALLEGGCIGLSTIKARNVKSEMHRGKKLVAFMFQCLSKERGKFVHNVYVVFERDGEFVPSPCSYCGCENGAFFCSHMLAFLYIVRIVQKPGGDMTKEEIEGDYPEDRRLVQNEPCLVEILMAKEKIRRQEAQSQRQKKQK
ncbi:hypothetical protein ACHAXT_009211 [Thalassiosira profunda]